MATRPPLPTAETTKTTALRVPPQSVEAEQAVLGGLMLDNSAWDLIADRLHADDFYRHDHRLMYTAIGELREKDEPCDAVTLSERLDTRGQLDDVGGLAYVGALAKDTPSSANITAYASIVREKSILRQLIDVGTEIAGSAYQPEGQDSKDILDQAEQAVFEIADKGMRHRAGFVRLKDILSDAVDRIDALYNMDGSVTGVPTGFTDFDRETSGLQKGDLVIVAGRPSMGKTAFAMNIAEHAALKHGQPVLVFSMEMAAEQLAIRLISSHGRINQQRLRTGDLTDDDWPRVTSAVALLADARIYIDDSPSLSPNDIRARARRMKREHGLELIIVDYLQLMQVPSTRENRATEIGEISRNLKALAKELKVPVVALSQLNRALESRPDKRPRMADLRESGSLEQDADVIVFIYRDEVYNEDTPHKGKAEIIIAKQRNGPIGTTLLTFLGEYTRFENYSAEPYGTFQ
ncbi:MAG: replicative DNA helicase [Gammaproteobacteria bacterium]|nr:MAG: replicative DNA helicase [Gammaproteobacteria bacterium]